MAILASRTENDGVGGGQADVAGRDEVHATADAVAVDRRDDGLGAACTEEMESCRRSTSLRAPRARAAMDGGEASRHRRRRGRRAPSPLSRPPMALRSRPTEKWGPLAAMTTTRTECVVAHQGRHGPGQVAPEVGSHGVAGLGPVKPHRGHLLVLLNGQYRRVEGGELSHRRRLTGPVGAGRRPVECMGRLPHSHPDEREVRSCPRSPPRHLPAWPGPTGSVSRRARGFGPSRRLLCPRRARRSGVTRRSTVSTSTSSGPSLPGDVESDASAIRAGGALWRSSPRPWGRWPGASSSRTDGWPSSTWKTAPGERLAVGPAQDVAASSDMLGSVLDGGDALVRLNDAFTPEPLFVDIPTGSASTARSSSSIGAARGSGSSRASASAPVREPVSR